MPFLMVQQPGEQRARVELEVDRMKIGRSVKNDLCLYNDPSASRFHAELEREGDRFLLQDVGSRHGTSINGRRVSEVTELRPGDRIVIGRTVIVFASDDPSDAPGLTTAPIIEGEEELPSMNTMMMAVSDVVQSSRSVSDSAPGLPVAATPQTRAFALLSEVAADLLAHRPMNEALELVMDLVWKATAPDRASLMLLEGDPPSLRVRSVRSGEQDAQDIRISRTIADSVLRDAQAVLLSDTSLDDRFAGSESIFMEQIRSAMCTPLWDNKGIIGLVYVDRRSATATYTRDDLQVLSLVANLGAVKIENCRLFLREQQMRRVEQELAAAARIQDLLLPAEPPALAGYEISGANVQCRTVGGDYYDWYTRDDGRLVLAIGDVSGKGIGAALLMATVQATFRAHLGTTESLRELVARLNRAVLESSSVEQFLTFFCSELDPATGVLRFVNAGHNPPLLLRADGEQQELSTGGVVLGILPQFDYDVLEVELAPGDVLALYSDGITETTDADGVEFGPEGLDRVIRRHPGMPVAELQKRVFEAVSEFAGADAEQFDDMTLVLVRRQ